MNNAGIVVWEGIVLFLGLMFALPDPYRHLLWISYSVSLSLRIIYKNRKQQRAQAGRNRKSGGAGAMNLVPVLPIMLAQK
jgi:hypothetical protein